MRTVRKLLTMLLVLAVLGAQTLGVSAEWIVEEGSGESVESLILASDAEEWQATAAEPSSGQPEVHAKGAVLMEMSTGKVLFEQGAHEKLPIASVTKVMTMLLIMEAIESGAITFETMLTCSSHAASYGGSQIWLEEGEQMSLHDLLKAIAVVSANDACAVVAEHLSGSVEGFVAQMNARAAELGMSDTVFKDCCGLDDTANSSAADIAVATCELMKHDRITEYTTIWMDSLRGGESQLVNTNKLVRYYKGATGMKTGTTAAAGHCLSATATRDGMSLCAVVLGCDTTDHRFGGARQLLDYGFANYAVYTPSVDPSELAAVPVLRGERRSVAPTVQAMKPILLKKGEEKQVAYTVKLAKNVEAPVLQGQTLGRVEVMLGESVCAEYPLIAETAVERLRVGVAFGWLLRALIC